MCGGTSATKALAASCAATMRVGFTSSTRMLREMSMASTIVDWAHGSASGALGRANENSSSTSAAKISAGGTWRRQALPGCASRTTCRLDHTSTAFLRRRSSHRYSAGSTGSSSRNHRL
jgi:hypothetical protein